MSGNEAEVAAQVELLVQSGTVAPDDREKAMQVLRSLQRLQNIQFFQNESQLDSAARALDTARRHTEEAIHAINEERVRWECLLEDLKPIADDPRCLSAFQQLVRTLGEFQRACELLSPPSGPPGGLIRQLQEPWAAAVRDLRKAAGVG